MQVFDGSKMRWELIEKVSSWKHFDGFKWYSEKSMGGNLFHIAKPSYMSTDVVNLFYTMMLVKEDEDCV